MKEIMAEGIGIEKPVSRAFYGWDGGDSAEKIFNWETGIGLWNSTFYCNCKFYGLCASDEHQNLEIGQYEIGEDEIGTHLRFKGQSSEKTIKEACSTEESLQKIYGFRQSVRLVIDV